MRPFLRSRRAPRIRDHRFAIERQRCSALYQHLCASLADHGLRVDARSLPLVPGKVSNGFDTGPVTPVQISRMKSVLDRFPFDGQHEFRDDQIYFLDRYLNADREMRRPFRTEAGCVLCWDGRLDNRPDLADAVGSGRLRTACDVELVGAA